MDVGKVRRFRVSSRSLALIVPLVTLLIASAIWNIRQHDILEQQRKRTTAVEQAETARAKLDAAREEARRKKNAEWAASDARVQQLYREIDGLSRISERVLVEPVGHNSLPDATGSLDKGDATP